MNEIALVTGGSSVVIQAICREWIRPGRKFIFLGRSEATIKVFQQELEIKGCETFFLSCDLENQLDLEKTHRWLDSNEIKIDYLILGASVGHKQLFRDSSLDKLLAVMKVSASSTVHLLKIVLPLMISPKARVLIFSSTAAFQPGPGNAVYFAAKAFQNSLIEALVYEHKDQNIRFLLLCPGPLIAQADWSSVAQESGFLKRCRLTSLEKMASRVDFHFERRTALWIPGIGNRIFNLLSKLMPKNFRNKMILKLSLNSK